MGVNGMEPSGSTHRMGERYNSEVVGCARKNSKLVKYEDPDAQTPTFFGSFSPHHPSYSSQPGLNPEC